MKGVLLFVVFIFLSFYLPTGRQVFLFATPEVKAANSLDVVINEIAWMGTSASANDEWLELYNNTSSPITLDGWLIKANDGTPALKLTGTIPSNGFYLLERTDDTTVPHIAANQIYTGAMGNSGEDLKLFDSSNNLIDEVNCTGKWFAGDNATKQTMETLRQAQGENRVWQTSKNPGGSPKSQNSQGEIASPSSADSARNDETINSLLRGGQQADEAISITQNSLPNITYPTGVVINEILPSPEGTDDQGEWIELYNQNNFEVDLSGWKIEDMEGAKTTYAFDKNTKIAPNGFLVLKRPETKITLNNSEDGLNLFWPNDKIVDSLSYIKASVNQSYNRVASDWQWSANLTPGSANKVIQPASNSLPKTQNSDNNIVEAGLAGLKGYPSQNINTNQEEMKNNNPWFLFFTAIIITIISAIIVLILKMRFKEIKKSNTQYPI